MIRRFFSSIPKDIVNVTPRAWNRMETIITSQDAFCFHLDIKSGGCNGFSYDMKLLNFLKYFDMTE